MPCAALGYVPGARVHVETVSEEECTGNGALSTLARGCRADAAFIPESMGHKLIRAELGSVWFRLRILGRPGHVPGERIDRLARHPRRHRLHRGAEDADRRDQCRRQGPSLFRPDPGSGEVQPRQDPRRRLVSARCRPGANLECRLSRASATACRKCASASPPPCANAPRRLDADMPALTWIGFQADGHVFKPGTEAEALLTEIHETVIGAPLEPLSMTATSDTRFYDLYYGIPALCYGGIGQAMHSPSEAVRSRQPARRQLKSLRFS